MAIKQKIRTKTGFEIVTLTPMKAIRKNCYECVGWNYAEVRRCEIDTCCFYQYRTGKKGSGEISESGDSPIVED